MVCIGLYWIQITVTPVVCFVCSYNIMTDTNNDGEIDASSNYGPLVVSGAIATIAFLLARAFAAVYEQTVTALTVCVLHDIDEYDPPFISRRLYEAFELEPDWEEFRAKGLGRQRRQYRGEGLGKADLEHENRGPGDQDRTPDRWWAGVARKKESEAVGGDADGESRSEYESAGSARSEAGGARERDGVQGENDGVI